MTTGVGTISSAGIGSGLDVNSIVSKLMAIEQQPLTNLQSASTAMQTKLSAFGTIKSDISALHDAAAPLYSADMFALTSTSSSDPSVSAGTTTKAVPGSYSISVAALSTPQVLASAAGQFAASTDPVGTGSITIRLGTWSAGQTTFTPKTGSADITIPIGASDNTLAGIRDKINAAGAGVSASLVTDASGTRIALQSTTSGAANGFRVSVADDDTNNTDNAGLSRLAFDPQSGVGQMGLAQSAANAQATINGITVNSASNTLDGVVDGVTFSLTKVTTTPAIVTIASSTDPIKAQLKAFVTAYNQLNQFLADSTKYDPTTKQGALLQGDSTTVSLQSQLHSLVGQPTGASSTFTTFSSLGVQLQTDGSLVINDQVLSTALTNLPETAKALSNVDPTTPGNNGIAKRFAAWSDQMLASNGAVPGKTASIQAQIASNQKDQDALNTRLAADQARLQKQYSSLDATMASSNALSSFVTQQIATWNKNTGN